jgi:hypothetical protein
MLRLTISGAVVTALIAGCGGSNSNGGSTPTRSGLPESALVTSLSDSELTSLCDWAADYAGGAGASLACDSHVNSPDQCFSGVRAAANCTATVSDVETCTYAVTSNACTALGNPACGALASCN